VNPHSGAPAVVSSLDLDAVAQALARHSCNVTDAAADLSVAPSALRRLMWANPALQDAAFEQVEARFDKAEANIAEALHSADSRRRDAANFFVIRNSARARKRGWITTSTSAAEVSISVSESGRVLSAFAGKRRRTAWGTPTKLNACARPRLVEREAEV
jgi:hypothetical protein